MMYLSIIIEVALLVRDTSDAARTLVTMVRLAMEGPLGSSSGPSPKNEN